MHRMVIAALLVVSCSGGEPEAPARAASGSAPPAAPRPPARPEVGARPPPASSGSAGGAAAAAPPAIAIRARLDRLPPFGRAAGAPSAPDALDEIMRDLDPYHPQPEGALVHAIEVVTGDPASAPARYLLACALAANGRHDDARAALEVLRAAKDCPSCRDALLNAARDGECGFAPPEVAVASGLAPSPVRAATEAVVSSLASGDAAVAAPYLDASRPAAFALSGLECDAPCTRTERHTRRQILALIRGAPQRSAEGDGYVAPVRLFCDDRCCRGPNPSHSHAPAVRVSEMCFRAGPRPLLRSLAAGVDG